MKRRRPLVIRGCSSERGTCAEITEIDNMHKDVIELVSCTECSTNNCNANSGVNKFSATFTVVSFAVVILVPAYCFFCNFVYQQISSPKYHITILHA